MKTKLFTFFLALAASAGTMFAEKVQIGNLYYDLNATNHTAEVTSQNSNYPYWSTSITVANIPSSVTYKAVVYNVTRIGDEAFSGCTGLTSVTIPNSVTSIGQSAFLFCTSLTSVNIPNSVTSIGKGAFHGCTGLTSVTIPNSVTSIGEIAFAECTSLNSLTIGNSVTSIGEGAFNICTSLTSVIIPNSVTNIGMAAFSGCTNLSSVTIGNGVTNIGEGVFALCSSLTSIDVSTANPNYCSVDGVMFDKDKTALIQYPGGKQGTYTIPNSVTTIGEIAFLACSGLTSIEIPNSVTNIGGSAFDSCNGLTSIEIPESVTSIGDYAFSYCTNLTTIFCEPQVPPTENSAFEGNSSLSAIYVPCGSLEAYQASWKSYKSYIQYYPSSFYLEVLTNDSLAGSVNILQDINMCDGVIEAVPNYGYEFMQWSDGITDNPRTIVLTQDTTFTAEFGFVISGSCGDNNQLTWTFDSINRTLSITGEGALGSNYTYGLQAPAITTRLIIGEGITSIGVNAFKKCSAITDIIWNATNCADFAEYEKAPFFDIRKNITSFTFGNYVDHIPARICTGMSNAGNIIIPPSVTSIGAGAFNSCIGLTSISIPGITSIENETFSFCTGLTSINIPNSVTSIGERAFYGCTGLTSIEIPNGVTSIGMSAFNGCTGLVSVTIPESVTTLGQAGTFQQCPRIKEVYWNAKDCELLQSSSNQVYPPFYQLDSIENFVFGEKVEKIPNWLCTGAKLNSIVIPNKVLSIGQQAFQNCQLSNLVLGTRVKEIGNSAFQGNSLDTITSYAKRVPTVGTQAFDGTSTSTCILYVLADYMNAYETDNFWGDFIDIRPIGANSTQTEELVVTPADNTANVVWPAVSGAVSYELVIKDKEGNEICTLIFNANGQLTSIAFRAPSMSHAPMQTQTAGFEFTVTGLEEGKSYDLTMTSKDSNGAILDQKTVSFTTGDEQGIDNVQRDNAQSKLFRNGQILILRGDHVYTLTGQEVQ